MAARRPKKSRNGRKRIRDRRLLETLRQVLKLPPVRDFIAQLEEVNRTGRPPTYPPDVMLAVAVAKVLFKATCWTDALELVRENSDLRRACSITSQSKVPSQDACYRFTRKLRETKALDECDRALVGLVAGKTDDFGNIVAIDATDIEAYSNQCRDPVSDPDARVGMRHNGNGDEMEFYFGYKLHLMVDAEQQIPIEWKLTPANANDGRQALPLFKAAKKGRNWLKPKFGLMDRGYDYVNICRDLEDKHKCHPIIPLRDMRQDETGLLDKKGRPHCQNGPWIWKGTDYKNRRTKSVCPYKQDQRVHRESGCGGRGKGRRCWLSWKQDPRKHKLIPQGTRKFSRVYSKRTSVDREFSLLKDSFLLSKHRVRGLERVAVHVNLCLLVRLATFALNLSLPHERR